MAFCFSPIKINSPQWLGVARPQTGVIAREYHCGDFFWRCVMCKKLGMPDYVVVRHGDGALCVSIRDLDREQVLGGLFALCEFFAQTKEVFCDHETLDFKTSDRITLHPGRC